jgi:hypothetical protein
LPSDDTTPPVTKMYFAAILSLVGLGFGGYCAQALAGELPG